MSKQVIIIGAGVAGIAASIRLSAAGFQVHVLESNNGPGGKLGKVQLGKYRFDTGPSLFTLPEYVDELFLLAKKNPRTHFNYHRLDVTCSYHFSDGKHLVAYSDKEKLKHEISSKLGISAEAFLKHLTLSAKMYALTSTLFLESSLHKWKTYVQLSVLKALVHLPSLHLVRSLHSLNETKLKNKHLTQLFDRYATYNGSNPYQTPGVMHVIPHLEHNIGAYLPEKGMYQITDSLYELAKEMGVTFSFNEKVEKIRVENGRVMGVETGTSLHKAPIVISNMDVVPTYKKLLADQVQPTTILSQERSSSALIFYWGIRKKFNVLDVHNIFFAQDYKAEFDHIFGSKTLHNDPTIYINITSKKVADDAPENGENWFVMINVPHNTGQDWKTITALARKNIIEKLNRVLNDDIEPLIEEEKTLDPVLIEKNTSSYLGALYGAASNNRMAAFLRHPNFSKNIEGMYFCGGSVHPGGGIPLSLLSAKIATTCIINDQKK